MKKKYKFFAFLFLLYFSIPAQNWISFSDETSSRIVVSNISDNTNSSLVDDQEKDLLVGDFNKDGFDDLIVVRKTPFSEAGAKTDLVFLNNGNGVLEDKTDIYAPEFLVDDTDSRDVISVDVNNDTWLDLFIINTFGDQPKLYINRGNDENGDWLGFQDEPSRLPVLNLSIIQYCAGWAGDVDGDGAPDLYMVNYDSTGLALDVLFMNDGTGVFTDESDARLGNLRNSSFGTGVEMHDIDRDNDLDIIKNLGLAPVSPFNDQGTIALYNNGDGTFTNFQKFPGSTSYMFTAGDLNNDGMLDFYEVDDFQDYVNSITDMQPDTSVTINQTFINSDRTDVWGGNVKMVDIDNDGDLDVTIASVDTDEPPCNTENNDGGAGGSRTFVIFENDGLHSGNIIDPYDGVDNIWDVSNYDQDFIDINNDGLLDIILGTCEGYTILVQGNTLSIDQIESQETSIHPIPNDGKMTINFNNPRALKNIAIYSISGALVKEIKEDDFAYYGNSISIDISDHLKPGVYFFNLKTETQEVIKKVIIE